MLLCSNTPIGGVVFTQHIMHGLHTRAIYGRSALSIYAQCAAKAQVIGLQCR
jgi:acyl dehydratase